MVQITPESRRTLNDFRARYGAVMRPQLTSFSDIKLKALVIASRALQRLIATIKRNAGADADAPHQASTKKPRNT